MIDFKLISLADKFEGLAHLRSVEITREFILARVPLFIDDVFSVSLL